MSALDRLPALATTGVGSLPFSDPVVAARHAARAYDVPFCPQLPLRDGDMVHEWLGGDPGRCGWSADRDRQRPAAWSAFLAEVAERANVGSGIVKLQVTGPLTLAIALERAGGRSGAARGAHAVAGEIAGWLAANVADQVVALRALGLDALLVVDEPGLAHAGLDPGRPSDVAVWDPLRNTGAVGWGLHICGAVPWALVTAAAPDLLSFDVARELPDAEAGAALTDLLASGTRIAWGAVDPVDPADAVAVAERVSACLAAAGGEDATARSLLTPSCGTGRLSERRERLVAETLRVAAGAAL